MDIVFLGIVIFLFLLAVFDLSVGVSNDAVNFLNSAIGSRAATFKVVITVAAVGVFVGASMSNGMMDIARHGIFRPEHFTFYDVICIFMAVMVTDIILLDVFNTLGMPTSTTVSMVFELLGAAFAISLLKMAGDSCDLTLGDLLNTEKAISVILGIFLSVAVAFVFGMVVQWLSRAIFTFNYRSRLRWKIGIFGGVASTAIIYFLLIKGIKDLAFMTPELKAWINGNTPLIIGGCFVFFTVLMQILHMLKVNVFKVVVLMGTFSLAMAFAGNDLVNFIGVPLSGLSAYNDYIANGTGDPGAFMDRSVMEGDPHKLLEGMAIAGFAVGADEAYIYVRAEYPLAIKRLRTAIKDAENASLLGKNIMGSGFNFDIHIKEGAGAFVCGEETALIASIEGERGMPRPKPPFPANKGLFGKPTLINNVETLANVPVIILKGADWFSSLGADTSKGTKTFALTGEVNNTGLIEVPMGTTLRQIVFELGGGIRNGKKFKAVQIGGPSGGCLTEEHLDLTLDYDSLIKAGAMVGSGGLVVMNEDTCIVEVARFFMNFTQNESCGKCVPCREGTKNMLKILEKITRGEATLEDLDLLEELAVSVKDGSLCGLGKTAPNPVLSTLKYFRDEYIAHIVDKKCPAGVCTALKVIEIDKEKCKGCSKCSRICPVGAISGEIKQPFSIDKEKCIKCGACLKGCPFNAIVQK